MQPTTKTVGGGPATGLSGDWIKYLQEGLNTGTFGNPAQQAAGANPIGSTQGMAGTINTILQGGGLTPEASKVLSDIMGPGAGMVGGSLQEILRQKQMQDVADVRARYSIGGGGAGTPAGFAESLYRAQAAPQAATQIGQLQIGAMNPLLQAASIRSDFTKGILALINAMAGKGIPQASTVVGPSPFSQVTSAITGAASGYGAIKGSPTFGGGGASSPPSVTGTDFGPGMPEGPIYASRQGYDPTTLSALSAAMAPSGYDWRRI